jgi:predicted nucleic acid-binding protein
LLTERKNGEEMTSKIAMFDTNIYVNHNLGYEPLKALFPQVLQDGYIIGMSSIVAMELMWYSEVKTDSLVKAKRQLYIDRAHKILPVDKDVALLAAEIQREWQHATGKKPKHGDLLIAATAIVDKAVLYSNNDKDFKYIRDGLNFKLNYINPIANQSDLQNYLNSL